MIDFTPMTWRDAFGVDYYGALQVATEYCGLRRTPEHFPGCWQHGMWPPWQMIQPEVIVYNAPRSIPCFVARRDEEAFLRRAGYRGARAIGLPIIYTKSSGLSRIPQSLLVMPTHSLPSDVLTPPTQQYVAEIGSIKDRFGFVAASISPNCIDRGLWVSDFEVHGIPTIRGAGRGNRNALARMRALFDRFEYMTTDAFGSHVYYALYFGMKVSIWGTATPVFRENVLSDGAWAPFPEMVNRLFTEENKRQAEAYLGSLRVDPWCGVRDVEAGGAMVGHESRLSPVELRKAFGWSAVTLFYEAVRRVGRQTPVWPVATAMKRGVRRFRQPRAG